jgi:hypothetical protein
VCDVLEDTLRRVDIDRPRFTYTELRRHDDAAWAQVVSLGLVHRVEDIEWAECDWCGEADDLRYKTTAKGRVAYLKCRECGPQRVEPVRLQQWMLHFPRLAERLAAALDCGGRVEEIATGYVWLLGRITAGGRQHDVFFARQLAFPEGADALRNCARFQASRHPVVVLAGAIPRQEFWTGRAPVVLRLQEILKLEDGRLHADRAYVEGALSRDEPKKAATARPSPFATPAGATWNDVQIRFADAHTVSVRVLGMTGLFHYAQMGMEDRRTTLPTEQWKLLRTFAEAPGGVLDWESREARRTNKKRCEKLVKDLVRFFGIEGGTPIEYSKREQGWRTVVSITA